MQTPGPWISFLTSRWLLPQNEQLGAAWSDDTGVVAPTSVTGFLPLALGQRFTPRPLLLPVGDMLLSALAGVEGGDHGAWIGKVCRTFTRRGSTRALRAASSRQAARNASIAATMSLTNEAIPMSTRCG